MTGTLLMAVAIVGSRPADGAVRLPELAVQPWSVQELRDEYRATLSRARRSDAFVAERDVPQLVLLYQAVEHADALTRRERIEMRSALAYRLESAAERLQRQAARETGRAGSSRGKASRATAAGDLPPAPAGGETSTPQGGAAVAANVAQLIDLIEATIQPESWDVNGGAGSIRYYAPLQVLVIRNTEQVHREIGGLRSALRP